MQDRQTSGKTKRFHIYLQVGLLVRALRPRTGEHGSTRYLPTPPAPHIYDVGRPTGQSLGQAESGNSLPSIAVILHVS